jgi:hypothetical protein
MKSPQTARGTGIDLVMTDLFVSASAALMMVLAISRPTPDVPLPIQADLIATCPSASTILSSDTEQPALHVFPSNAPTDMDRVSASDPESLWGLPQFFDLPPRLFYTIALKDGAEPVTSACANWALNDIVRAANKAADTRSEQFETRPPPIFGLEVAARAEADR